MKMIQRVPALIAGLICAATLFTGAEAGPAPNPGTAVVPMDSIAPWVRTIRYIPVVKDGQIIGYIVVEEWVWVPDERQEQ